ncbi:MAG TPA: hypothetical protein ENO05_06190 [Bacteroides sp.]|nr:hypothetical protein [Bacteroides sp.]
MRTTLLCLLLFIGIPLLLSGQSAEEAVIRLKDKRAVEETGTVEETRTAVEGEPLPARWNLSLGTSYIFMQGAGSALMLHAAPVLTLPVTDRWSLHGGVMAEHTVGLGPFAGDENYQQPVFSSLALYAAASYRMNERLVLHGTGYKQLLRAPVTPFTPFTPPDHFSLGATYKLGDHFTIGASVHMERGSSDLFTPGGRLAAPYPGGFFAPSYGNGLYGPHNW